MPVCVCAWDVRGPMEPHITPTRSRDAHRSISIRTSFYCLACWNISRRPDPIDRLCASLCLYVLLRSSEGRISPSEGLLFTLRMSSLSFFSFLHIWSNPDKHNHLRCFLSLPLLLVLLPFRCCYFANRSPTHTTRWEQLVKGQAM